MQVPLLLLRIGIAFAFVYAGVSGFMNPAAWVGFFPPFLADFASPEIIIGVWGVLEILLALAILFIKRVFYPALLAAVLLFGVTIFNLGAMDIVFRDVSIGLAAVALALLSRNNERVRDNALQVS